MLTIVIPTYNRRESLRKGLEALIPQVERHKDQVSLYISDNCSDDGTAEVVGGFQARYPDLIGYKRQSSNLGAQGNFRDAVLSVDSKYVVLFSDDDVALPFFMDTVMEQLHKHPDVAMVNYNALTVSEEGEFRGVRDSISYGGAPKLYNTGSEFIKEHTHVPSLVSSNIFLREGFIREADKISIGDYPGYDWYAALMKSIVSKACVYLDVPLFLANSPSCQRWERNAPWYYVVGLSRLFKELDASNPGIWSSWKGVFHSTWFENYCLNCIARYQNEYRERYVALIEWSPSEEFSRKLKYYLFHSARYRHIMLGVLPKVARSLSLNFLK